MQHEDLSKRPEWLSAIPPEYFKDCRAELFGLVRERYDSPGRYYHTWTHILACLTRFAALRFDAPRAVFFALLFHDAVYVPGRRDNEELSATLAEELLARYSPLPTGERHLVAVLIRLTAEHHAAGRALDSDAAKFLDVDLSILGSPWATYQQYMKDIKREYCPSVVSEADYPAVRSKFLTNMLDQENIFASLELRPLLEQRARANIQAEIALLLRPGRS